MARKLNPENRERLIDEMLERAMDIAAGKDGEDYLRRWWRRGRKGYNTMSDEELLREATACLGFDVDGPELSDLEIQEGEADAEVTDDAETGVSPAESCKARVSALLVAALQGIDPALRNAEGYVRWGLVEKRLHALIDKYFPADTGEKS